MTRCRCPGYDETHHDHDTTSGDCFNRPVTPRRLCDYCDDARYAAIGRAAERLHQLLTERVNER